MVKSREQNYNEHAKFLADIALEVLRGNSLVLDINGVKEIIALYLLIPYATPQRLDTPGGKYKIPRVDGNFAPNIQLRDLRDAICHSFVTVEEDKNDGSRHGKQLIVDDRATLSRKNHDELEVKSKAVNIDIMYAHKKLEELFEEIIKQ
jgi:hypothetical protein